MVVNFNLDLETRMMDMYKTMLVSSEQPKAEERKELSPNEFWNTMQMVSQKNQSLVNFKTRK